MGKDNTLVKYPSYNSLACRLLPGKKIFLFRNLKDHLEKITSKDSILERNLYEYYPHCHKRNLFPKLKINSNLQKLAFVWVHRYLDAYYSQEVLSINSNEFFLEPKKIMNKVTNFLNIKPVENYDPIKFYVKKDFNCTDNILSEIKAEDQIKFDIKRGYINSNNFSDIEEWVNNEIFNKIKPHNIFPYLRDESNNPIYSFLPGITIKM